MTAQGDFRSRARAVRAATQRKLLELRSERLGKLRNARQLEPDSAFENDTGRGQGPERPAMAEAKTCRAPVNVPKPSLLLLAVSERAAALSASLAESMERAVDSTGDGNPTKVEGERLAPAAPRTTVDAAVPGSWPDAHDGAKRISSQPSAQCGTQSRQHRVCDLYALPGAGPGLIWLLQRQNIHSMSDLAEADANLLSQKLNLVGQLLDMESWILFAKYHHRRSVA